MNSSVIVCDVNGKEKLYSIVNIHTKLNFILFTIPNTTLYTIIYDNFQDNKDFNSIHTTKLYSDKQKLYIDNMYTNFNIRDSVANNSSITPNLNNSIKSMTDILKNIFQKSANQPVQKPQESLGFMSQIVNTMQTLNPPDPLNYHESDIIPENSENKKNKKIH